MFASRFAVLLLTAIVSASMGRGVSAPLFSLPTPTQAGIIASTAPDRLLPIVPDRGPKKRDLASMGMEVTAASAIVVDRASGSVLFEKNADEVRSIASITKLMTALIVLDTNPDFATKVSITADDETSSSNYLRVGETLTMRDLFAASLIGSANDATRAMVRATNLSLEEFVHRMNARAAMFGMGDTHFSDVTGLDAKNVSTARDLTVLIRTAASVPAIASTTTTPSYILPSGRIIRSTDLLLGSFVNTNPYAIATAKTGSLDEAGFCFGVAVNEKDHGIIGVVLGSSNDFSRFSDMKALVYWSFSNWDWTNTVASHNASSSSND